MTNVGVMTAEPFIKWAGGKRRLVATIRTAAPPVFERYLEPFVGGGALALALGHRPMLLNDANTELIDAYRAVRDRLPALIDRLAQHERAHDLAYYYRMRAIEAATLPLVERAARFIYLNKTCFNGLYRVNRQGGFNVPAGRYSQPVICDRVALTAASAALQGSQLFAQDYRCFLEAEARAGDFIYLDPPYAPVGRYSDFKRYTSAQFYEQDQRQLAQLYDELVALGAYPVLSNSYTPLTLELYRRHRIQIVKAGRSINHDGAGRAAIREILVRPARPTGPAEATGQRPATA